MLLKYWKVCINTHWCEYFKLVFSITVPVGWTADRPCSLGEGGGEGSVACPTQKIHKSICFFNSCTNNFKNNFIKKKLYVPKACSTIYLLINFSRKKISYFHGYKLRLHACWMCWGPLLSISIFQGMNSVLTNSQNKWPFL